MKETMVQMRKRVVCLLVEFGFRPIKKTERKYSPNICFIIIPGIDLLAHLSAFQSIERAQSIIRALAQKTAELG